ncbi:MAG: LamB/YcsF family protein, partial [Solirubrobacteraceae bacterium]
MLIDLNADVGERPGAEGIRADGEIMMGISSANVACGFHAGDGATMRAICELAALRHKRIGAHVSYLDREGFGRRAMEVDPGTLREHVVQQIQALSIEAAVAGVTVTYVKPHGALYH